MDMADNGHIHHSIDYIEFSVTDMAESQRFYEAAFGWKFPGVRRRRFWQPSQHTRAR